MNGSTGDLGRLGEELAARHLADLGMRLEARNWRCAVAEVRGELDIVAWDGPTLVFCEVKARRGNAAGGALAAVTPRKLAQLRRLAGAYLAERRVQANEVRFDVVGVEWRRDGRPPRLTHLRGVL